MTTYKAAEKIERKFIDAIYEDLEDIKNQFGLGLISSNERFQLEYEINKRLQMWFNLSK